MDHVRTLIPPAARRWIYAIYILAGLIVGAVTVATGGLDWTAAAERVLAYLAVPLAVLAGVNVPTGGDWIDSQADSRITKVTARPKANAVCTVVRWVCAASSAATAW